MTNNIEELLYNKKIEISELKAPEDFESRINNALRTRRKKKLIKRAVIGILISTLLLTYSFDAIAYYGEKLLGYDDVTFGSIRQLNEEGKGQEIDKFYTFSDGTTITLNGIIFDDKELVAFYKIENKNKELNNENILLELKGLTPKRYHSSCGQGKIVDTHTQVWTMTFDPPAFFEKWMSLTIRHIVNEKYEEGSIKFSLDRGKALKHIVKYDINKEIKIGDVKVKFKTITASRLSTVVEETLEASHIPLKQNSGFSVEYDLIADGKKLQTISGNTSSFGGNINIKSTNDGLPAGVNSLQITNIHLVDRKMVDKNADLTEQTRDLKLTDDLVVKNVYFEGENTCIVIQSKGLPVMGLFINGREAENIEPAPPAGTKSSSEAANRVYKFRGRGEHMKLSVKTLDYMEFSTQSIIIPVD